MRPGWHRWRRLSPICIGRQRGSRFVSSGAIALGRTVLDLPAGALRWREPGGCGARGRSGAARVWGQIARSSRPAGGKFSSPLPITERGAAVILKRRGRPFAKLWNCAPVSRVNENDTVATNEIRYGDNDRSPPASRAMIGAIVVLFSDVAGSPARPPARNPQAKHLPRDAPGSRPEIEAMAGGAAIRALARPACVPRSKAAKIA